MAEYRDLYAEIQAAGACLAAVSADTAAESENLRTQLSLPFPILCDTERRVITDWDLLNKRVRAGIAKPAVFIIDSNLIVRFAAVDGTAIRVPATEILSFLKANRNRSRIRRKIYFPLLKDWMRAIRKILDR